jgi:hypothetical protein
MGPPPHAEDPYTRLTSPRGIPVDQLVSVLQKEIRRSNVDNAVLAAYEMLTTSPEIAEHLWHRLKLIAVEDIGMGEPLAPVLLNSLYENYCAATGGEQTMMAVHAVRFLATAKKDRTSSEHTDLVTLKVESGELVVVEVVWSERREVNVLAGNRPYRRPVIAECDLGLVWTELGQVVDCNSHRPDWWSAPDSS